MAQKREEIQRIAELNALFLALDARSQDSALIVLKSLSFAQSVIDLAKQEERPPNVSGK